MQSLYLKVKKWNDPKTRGRLKEQHDCSDPPAQTNRHPLTAEKPKHGLQHKHEARHRFTSSFLRRHLTAPCFVPASTCTWFLQLEKTIDKHSHVSTHPRFHLRLPQLWQPRHGTHLTTASWTSRTLLSRKGALSGKKASGNLKIKPSIFLLRDTAQIHLCSSGGVADT